MSEYGKTSRRTRSIWLYSRAIELNPLSADAFNGRGVTYMTLYEPNQALPDFTAAIEIRPSFVTAINNRRYAYESLGEIARAIDDYKRSIAELPDETRNPFPYQRLESLGED